jgi:NADP-dependent 3-hydroxy acid dehydrogenase YdfG
MSELAGQIALVSGASRGIGLEIARSLCDAGMRVAMLARSDAQLRVRAAELGDLAIPLVCDVTDPEAVRQLAEHVTKTFGGPPHAIVNNAGVFSLATVERTDPREFQTAIEVNLVGPFLLTRAFLAAMRARGTGHIVMIGSVADRATFPENGSYAASKFGLRALQEVLRGELRGSGVRTTLVSPGPVDTTMWDRIDPDSRPGFTPRREMMTAGAVAEAVRFALSRPAGVNVDELRLSHS